MSTKSHLFLKAVGGVSLAGAFALTGLSGCSQQGMSCVTAHGAFAVKLTLKTGDGECSQNPGGTYGVNSYNYEASNGRPDLNRPSMAIQSAEIGAAYREAEDRLGETPDPTSAPYAKGDFGTAEPGAGDVCEVPTLTKAAKSIPVLPAVPDDPTTPDDDESLPEKPAETFGYEWSNLRFLVSEAAPGTRFVGDLKYEHNGCTATFEAWGMYPAVGCDDGEGNPDDAACAAEADPEAGRPTGSGINPDFKVHCDPVLLLCMLDERPPVP